MPNRNIHQEPSMSKEPSISDLKSALQKFVRRGMRDEALQVTDALCQAMISTADVGLWEIFWKRLHVIASEDIGIACSGVHIYLYSLIEEVSSSNATNQVFDASQLLRQYPREIYRVCRQAVASLVDAPKSRLTDHAYIYIKETTQTTTKDIDHATLYDLLQVRNEEKLLHLVAMVHRLQNNTKDRGTGVLLRDHDIYTAVLQQVTTEDDNNKDSGEDRIVQEIQSIWQAHQERYCVLHVMHLVLLACRGQNGKLPPILSPTEGSTIVAQRLPSMKTPAIIELPDFCYDMHTTRGRQVLGRGFAHFVKESCQLYQCTIPDPYYKLLLTMVEDREQQSDGKQR